MGDNTLTAEDVSVLRAVSRGATTVDRIGADVEEPRSELADRLATLADNGLVVETDEGTYELTDSGERFLEAPGDGSADDRIDVPGEMADAIAAMDLRADREDALFHVAAFLRYWGDATASEIVDAVYSETPDGFDSADEWWAFVRDRLAALPNVDPPGDDRGPTEIAEPWRYEGRAGVEEPTGDGRTGFRAPDDATYGSVRHALEEMDLPSDQRDAVREAFALLQRRKRMREDELRADLSVESPEDYATDEEWWSAIRPVLDELPGVERVEGSEDAWRYAGDDWANPIGADESPADAEE